MFSYFVDSGLNTVLMVHPLKVEPESQILCFSHTPNIQVPTAIASIENSPSHVQELHPKTSSPLLRPTFFKPRLGLGISTKLVLGFFSA